MMARAILKLTCSEMGEGGQLSEKYTFPGCSVNPPLEIENIPAAAKSLAVIMESFTGSGIVHTHWVAWNIPVTNRIRENELRGDSALNDFGKTGYWRQGSSEEILGVNIRVYALDRFLDFPGSKVSKFDLENEIRYFGLGHGKLVCSLEGKEISRILQNT